MHDRSRSKLHFLLGSTPTHPLVPFSTGVSTTKRRLPTPTAQEMHVLVCIVNSATPVAYQRKKYCKQVLMETAEGYKAHKADDQVNQIDVKIDIKIGSLFAILLGCRALISRLQILPARRTRLRKCYFHPALENRAYYAVVPMVASHTEAS